MPASHFGVYPDNHSSASTVEPALAAIGNGAHSFQIGCSWLGFSMMPAKNMGNFITSRPMRASRSDHFQDHLLLRLLMWGEFVSSLDRCIDTLMSR
jgi:hypothetical protein